MGQRLDALLPAGIHFGVQGTRHFVDELSDLLHQVAPLLHLVHLQDRTGSVGTEEENHRSTVFPSQCG